MEHTWNSQQTPNPDLANQRTKKIVRLVIVLFVLTDLPIGWLLYQFHFRGNTNVTENTVAFTVAQGESAGSVARRLAEEKVIGNSLFFRWYANMSNQDSSIRPGTFVLPARTSVSFALGVLTNTQSQERTITLLEGWTIRDMAAYLVKEGVIANEQEWYDVVGTPPGPGNRMLPASSTFFAQFPELAGVIPENASLEGFLFPDTYRISTDASAEDVARLMVQTYLKKAPRPADSGSEYDRVILASILEREVRSDEDRRKVADLFLRRLKVGMALQADSTVNYITGKKTASITLDDRDIDSLWNTYKYPGLPPTPISNPSVSALNAVLNPEPNDAWYFLTDDEGTVHYAATHDEHVANKNRYLK